MVSFGPCISGGNTSLKHHVGKTAKQNGEHGQYSDAHRETDSMKTLAPRQKTGMSHESGNMVCKHNHSMAQSLNSGRARLFVCCILRTRIPDVTIL